MRISIPLRNLFLPAFTICLLQGLSGQETAFDQAPSRQEAIRVYIDCHYCDPDYIRREIPWVNHVRDTRDAQVYILETAQATGSGGTGYTYFFQGQKEFRGMNDTLFFSTRPDDPADVVRESRTRMLKAGLIRYAARSPLITQVDIIHNEDLEEQEVTDKWNYWVFEIEANPEYEAEESYKAFDLENSFNATRITPDWKVEFDLDNDLRRTKYVEEDTSFVAERNSINMESMVVKSLTGHWSGGIYLQAARSTYRNLKLNYSLFPAVEYNIFPYSESNHRQLRMLYGIGFTHYQYNDTTIYNLLREDRFQQVLMMAYQVQEKWGSVNLSLEASNYLHDFSKNRLELHGNLKVRIVKGLSLSLYGGVGMIYDQLSLAKGDVSETERLLRLRELATAYSIDGGFGITYTFGSIYNNIVNPRFGD